MRKQTKLVAVLSAAALLALGASMTSFAAGWEKDDEGIWHYYDSDDEMVTSEWKKDGSKWFYLDDEGDMLTNDWVDDDYYVGEDGAMLVNAWVKTYADEDQDDPDEDGEHWYYFGSKGKKVTDDYKKINGKTYYFDEDGKMKTGWQDDNGDVYYLGEEDEGWRVENEWRWLEKSSIMYDDDDDDVDGMVVLQCEEGDECDDEGWYWFGSSGKMYYETGKKKINGKYYMFNQHGQMLYEWIDTDTSVRIGSDSDLNGKLDGNLAEGASAPSVSKLRYYNDVEDGSRASGWYKIDGAEDRGNDNDTDWYYVDKGELKYADGGAKDFVTYDDDPSKVYVQRIKIEGKYFAFNEEGQMQDGLQYCPADNGFYYFDSDGYMKTGKIASVECDDDDYAFYFETKSGKNGLGYKGEKDDYLYFNGKRLDANDDYRLWFYNGDVYLTNTKGKIQKAKTGNGKKFDIENDGIAQDDVWVKTDASGKVEYIKSSEETPFKEFDATEVTADELIDKMIAQYKASGSDLRDVVDNETVVSLPFISLYDDDIYTYKKITKNATTGSYKVEDMGWIGINDPSNYTNGVAKANAFALK